MSEENKINKQEDSKEKVSNGVVWVTSLCMSILLCFVLKLANDPQLFLPLMIFLGPPLIVLWLVHMGLTLSTIQLSESDKEFLKLFFWIGLPLLLVDLMWVIQHLKKQKDFLSYVESVCVLLPYCIILYFMFN